MSSEASAVAAAFNIDLIEDNRLGESVLNGPGGSISVEENDRLRGGERNDAGDNDEFLSAGTGIEVRGANRFSFVKESGR